MKFLKLFLQFTWCLPQTLLGFFMFIIMTLIDSKAHVYYKDESIVFCSKKFLGGLSLGFFVFGYDNQFPTLKEMLLRHEFGHVLQSYILGPLYLLLIGLPSIVWASIIIVFKLPRDNYYKLYTEKWADHVAGIKR